MSFTDSAGLKKFSTTAPHALPQWSERSNCVDQKMHCHRERSEASAERSRTIPCLSRTPTAWRDFSPRNSRSFAAHLSADQPAGVPNVELYLGRNTAPLLFDFLPHAS